MNHRLELQGGDCLMAQSSLKNGNGNVWQPLHLAKQGNRSSEMLKSTRLGYLSPMLSHDTYSITVASLVHLSLYFYLSSRHLQKGALAILLTKSTY